MSISDFKFKLLIYQSVLSPARMAFHLSVMLLHIIIFSALQGGVADAVELAHVEALIQKMLPAQLLVIDRGVRGFTRGGAVALGAIVLTATASRHSPIPSRLLRRHFSLLKHLLLIVSIHYAHLLMRIRRGAHSRILRLRLISLRHRLHLPRRPLDQFHAA